MNKPLIFAHRGASAYAPENTLAAFNLAFDLGADGIELDVSLTKDRVPMVIHDDTIDRTTDGHGRVSEMTLAKVKQVDAGSWKDGKYRGEKIPTLEEVLQSIPRDRIANIELKTLALRPWPANATQIPRLKFAKISAQMLFRLWEPPLLEQAVVQVIEKVRAEKSVIVSSFNPIALYRVCRLNPLLTRGLLYFSELPVFLGRAWLRPLARPHALHPRNTMLTAPYLEWAHRKSYKINTWTVDDRDEMRRLVALGVDSIITNKPEVLRAVLTDSRFQTTEHR